MAPENDKTAPASGTKPRWYQFSLRALLLLVTLAVILLFAWLKFFEPFRAQRAAMAIIADAGGSLETQPGAPRWLLDALGEQHFQNVVLVNLGEVDVSDECLDQVVHLPALETLVVSGAAFNDEKLRRLGSIHSLRWLVLDSTLCTDAAIARLRERLPELAVFRAQRRVAMNLDSYGSRIRRRRADDRTTSAVDIPPHLQRLLGNDSFIPVVALELFTNADFTELLLLQDLEALEVSWPALPSASHLSGAKELQELSWIRLNGIWVDDNAIRPLADIPKLSFLDLAHTKVTDAGMAHLARSRRLEFLHLDGTVVGDPGLMHIGKMLQLKELHIRGTAVGDAGLKHLATARQLRWVDVRDTRVTPAGAEALRRALPGCKVVR